MASERFAAENTLHQLKDFQRRTVDYVFQCLFSEEGSRRFLVADEVGLGKTMVARGIVARILEHLHGRVKRIDVVYVCSNAAIATQNVNRLNVAGVPGFALATRLTYLPVQVQQLDAHPINFISLTPGTALDHTRSRGGHAEERAILYRMLYHLPWGHGARREELRKGLYHLLQATCRSNWSDVVSWYPEKSLDDDLSKRFRKAVMETPELYPRLKECCASFVRSPEVAWSISDRRYTLIAELRQSLAKVCLSALEPDLIILDEFQRFKHLLDGDDDASLLANTLFNYPDVRMLLLSATPYKMLSLDHERDDDHYPDFLRTLQFLYNDPHEVEQVRQDIRSFRSILYEPSPSPDALCTARQRLQERLLKVMCRTERVGITRDLNAMLADRDTIMPIVPQDLVQAAVADSAGQAVGARDTINYWKSSPYLLNFLKHYDLRRKVDAALHTPSPALIDAIAQAEGQIIRKDTLETYQPLEAGNARMRHLFDETLDRGLWQLLWMPPSLPYCEPAGAYRQVGSVSKVLAFSAWNAVPDAVAAICSYEAERRMLAHLDRAVKHSELYDRISQRLVFNKERDRPTGMPVLSWMMPSPTLTSTIDPLEIALRLGSGGIISLEQLLVEAETQCVKLLDALPPGEEDARPDQRWYWVAPALLDAATNMKAWLQQADAWPGPKSDRSTGAIFQEHVAQYLKAAAGALQLGPRPADLPRVLAELALAGPGNCSLRALNRVAPRLKLDDPRLLAAAALIAEGFRTLFNLPETIALLRGNADEYYWRLALRHGLEGNMQAMLDEQMHVLVESLGLGGLADRDPIKVVQEIAHSLSESLSIRTVPVRIDELQVNGDSIERTDFSTRCRFALRFGDLRDDRGATLARAGTVREAFNSPFRPFILASTSIGQEGLDFHTWCHAVVHWNLPHNPVDLEQREGRVHRYKGYAVRKNIAESFGLASLCAWDRRCNPWDFLFAQAECKRTEGLSDIIPYWIYEEGQARIERRIPLLPFSQEIQQLDELRSGLALYRVVFGQPRQEDLLKHLQQRVGHDVALAQDWRINLEPPLPLTAYAPSRETIDADTILYHSESVLSPVPATTIKRPGAAESHQFQYEYWDAYRAYLACVGEERKPTRSRFYWQSYSLRIPGFSLAALYRLPSLPGHIAFAYSFNSDHSDRICEFVLQHLQEIEKVLGYPLHLSGMAVDEHRWLYTALKSDAWNREDWPNQFAWYREKHAEFYRAIMPFLETVMALL